MSLNNPVNEYLTTKNESALADATPHKLIEMLLDGALENIAKATGAIAAGNAMVLGESLGKAVSIVDSLQAMLDGDRGGEIAGNLGQLYEYIGRRLLEVSKDRDPEILTEVAGLLSEIKSGWDAMPPELKSAAG